MSRIGKLPIEIPKGVQANMAGSAITVKGPKGELSLDCKGHVDVTQEDGSIHVKRHSDAKQDRAFHGLYQRLIRNMVTGVSEGFKRELELIGVGYRAQMDGKTLVLSLGYSHDIRVDPGDRVSITTPGPNRVVVEGADKQVVGQVAAEIRAMRPPEPYKGKGVKYIEEHIRRKVGKTGA